MNRRDDVGLDWWNNGLQLRLHFQPTGMALAVLYALACWTARQYSLDQFYLPAGIRVAALLLCPPRLWGYLILGEYAYFAHMRIPMIDGYGLPWVVLGSASLMPAVALVVYLHRRWMRSPSEAWLLPVAAGAAAVATMLKVALPYLLWPTPPTTPWTATAIRYALGDFLAILALAPLALLWSRRHLAPGWNPRLVVPTVALMVVMGALALASTLTPPGAGGARTGVLLLMALPAIALTCLHGWRGAAIGVPLLTLLVHFTTPSTGTPGSFDAATFAMQQSMAVISIALLALGSIISHYRRQHRSRDVDERRVVASTRSSLMASEMELRDRALHLRRIGEGMDLSLGDVMDWLKAHGHHDAASRLEQTSAAHSREFRALASMVYPTALEQLGLYLALQTGGVREAWDQTHRIARPRLAGDPCQLTVGLQLAAYRTLTDAVSLLLEHETGQLLLRARCGHLRRRRGIFLSVALLDTRRHLSEPTTALLATRLTARALAYGGVVQCRGNRVRLVLLEMPVAAPARSSTVVGH
ncbi:MASE1 domain-containing protein [Stenotrophomonas sp. LGBM10]|uniref:MASE1 domain-containing protein n=1 Tax=Stenotrophomonas sp. LGBM10 TaxID=3390038 RepID=UPI00398BB03C